MPTPDTWELKEYEIPELEKGEILIKQEYISLDPAMRGWMNDTKSYVPPIELNAVMRAGTVGKVIQSNNHSKYKEGDVLVGMGGVQQYTVTDGKGYYPVDPSKAPLPTYIGTLGMPGMTAYFGLLEVGKLKEGDVVVVSGAAGAVGSTVGQIAKIKGCKVVGIAGGPDKCSYLINDLGFDAAIDYKNENVRKALKEACPDGVDIYFDNVGGEILDAVLTQIRMHARVVICGAISQYNVTQPKGPANYMSLLVNRATMQGMIVFDFADRYGEAAQQMAKWIEEGRLKHREEVLNGIDHFYEAFCKLFTGEKQGKMVLKVSED